MMILDVKFESNVSRVIKGRIAHKTVDAATILETLEEKLIEGRLYLHK